MAKTVKRTRSQRAKSTKSNKSRNKSRSKVRSKVRRRSKSMFMFMNKQLTKAQKKFRNRYVDERDVSPIRSITTRVNEMDGPLSRF